MLVQFVGPSLHWPSAVLDLSAFHHLGYVPAAPFALLPAVVMAAVGVLGIVGGIVLFERRDLAGA
jgi:ABC-2 type transport system permease protein